MKTMSSTDAKNRFGDLLESSEDGPVRIERNGRAIAYALSAADFDLVEDALALGRVKMSILEGDSSTLDVLHGYSTGTIPRRAALKTLGLRNYGQLLRALMAASIPPPVLSAADRKDMVRNFLGAMDA